MDADQKEKSQSPRFPSKTILVEDKIEPTPNSRNNAANDETPKFTSSFDQDQFGASSKGEKEKEKEKEKKESVHEVE